MALHDLIPKLTYRDYVLFPEDGKRHEIIDGEHYVTAAPFLSHQRLAFRLTLRVGGFIETNRLGLFFFAPADVLLSDHDVVQPDLFFISSARVSIAAEKNVEGAPDLVIEILSRSTSRLDKGPKLQAYDRTGVCEYWIFDPVRRPSSPPPGGTCSGHCSSPGSSSRSPRSLRSRRFAPWLSTISSPS
jgi:Uma2 family endonuclease